MTQLQSIEDSDSDLVIILKNDSRPLDTSRDNIKGNNVSAPSNMMQEKDAVPCTPNSPVVTLKNERSQSMDVIDDSIKGNDTLPPLDMMQGNDAVKSDVGDSQEGDRSSLTSHACEEQGSNDLNTAETNFDVAPLDPHMGDIPVLQYTATAPVPRPGGSSLTGETILQVSRPRNANVEGEHAANIVIFGETGVGKSSVVNLIAGEKRARVSNDVFGCTFQYSKQIVELRGIQCALWDTMGLDEGSQGVVPSKLAEANLKILMEKLANSGGIHLVMYCVRGTRLTTALRRNYDLFYVAVCQKKVPVVLVVTGLEHQEGEMETWWDENAAVLRQSGMSFTEHACITTLELDDPVILKRRSDSQKLLGDLVVQYARKCPWRIEPSFLRNLFGTLSMEKRIIRRVIVYDRLGITPCKTITRHMGGGRLEYEWVYVDSAIVSQGGGPDPPGILVFYTSELFDNKISLSDIAELGTFYDNLGRRKCLVIVVLRGSNDKEVLERCQSAILSHLGHVQVRCVVDAPAEAIDVMVEDLCIEREVEREGKPLSTLRKYYLALTEGLLSAAWWGQLLG